MISIKVKSNGRFKNALLFQWEIVLNDWITWKRIFFTLLLDVAHSSCKVDIAHTFANKFAHSNNVLSFFLH